MRLPSSIAKIACVLLFIATTTTGCGAKAQQEAYKKIRASGGRIDFGGSGLNVAFTGEQVNDETLACLRDVGGVNELFLDRVEISDVAVEHLIVLGELRQLKLRRTNLSEEAVERLKQKFPDLRILRE